MTCCSSRIDEVGYHSLEAWGRDLRHLPALLNEDPWVRLRLLRKAIRRRPPDVAARAELLGYRHYPDDVVRPFV